MKSRNIRRLISKKSIVLGLLSLIIILLCQNIPNSPVLSLFWDRMSLIKMADSRNEQRRHEADLYWKNTNINQSLTYYRTLGESNTTSLIINIVTTKRTLGLRNAGYLTQVAAKADKMSKKMKGIYLNVCNVHPGPGEHDEATNLEKYLPYLRRFLTNNPHHSNLDIFEREKDDYVFCMNEILTKLQTNCPLLMLEDDGLPHDDLIEVIQKLIKSDWEFDYAKFFAKSEWNGFGWDVQSVFELIALCSISVVLFGRRKVILSCLLTIVLALVLSRQFLSQWRRLSISLYTRCLTPDYGTVAVLYKTHTANLIMKNFSNVKCSVRFPLDIALSKFLKTFNLRGLLIQPNLVYHIGLYSSLKSVGFWPVDIAFTPYNI